MAFEEKKKFTFVSKALPADTFGVVSFKGFEGISKPYSFDIMLSSEEPEIDLRAILDNPATFTILRDDNELPVHGIVMQFEQLHEVSGLTYYHAVLVPKLWQLTLHYSNQLFLDKSVQEVIEEILKQGGLTSQDYQFKLVKQYSKWEYISQYSETHLDFISRWMEREGIYYFFEQTKNGEKMIIADSSTAHKDIPVEKKVYYAPPSALVPRQEEIISAFICRQKILPKKVILKDYNYRKPSLEIKGEAVIDQKGRGDVYVYGDHFKDPGQGNDLAKIRAEEIRCQEKIFHGESTCPLLCSGYFFELQEHYRQGFNQKYLLTEIEHEGKQAAMLLAGIEGEEAEREKEPVYNNRFVAIPADVQFRPERKTPKSRFYGTMNAKIDAAGSGQYAEIDSEGRYKVVLPYDLSGNKGGKASRWVRMAQPYAGADYGMHFPLHKDIEVLLTFVDGDPDRPIISGSVPNPETMSPITSMSQTKSRVRTAAQNEIMMEDSRGAEMIYMYSPHSNSKIFMGAPASTNGIRATTDGHGVIHAKKGIYLNAWPTDYWSTGDAAKYINAGIAAANGVGVAAAAAGGGSLAAIPAIMQVAAAVANIAAPGIVLSSPAGISCITPSTFTAAGIAGVGIFTPAVANIVGVTSAALMSGGGVYIYTIAGGINAVASSGDIKINAKSADIRGTASQNIVFEAKTNNFNVVAKKEIDMVAEDQDISLQAQAKDIVLIAQKNIKITAEDNRLQLMASNQDILLEAETKVILRCGSSSIVLKKNGDIAIKGANINIEGSGMTEVKTSQILKLQGAQTRINC